MATASPSNPKSLLSILSHNPCKGNYCQDRLSDTTVPHHHNHCTFAKVSLTSFADDDVRARFVNKFYQCLLAFQMPHKVRKLVVVGPKDSGKTSWSNIFYHVILPGYVASLTKENQFSAAMIKNETQLVLVDEWSASTMQSDLVNCILQGGWMVAAVKHGLPRTVLNNSPYYVTTNNLPNFGKEEDENVQRRIEGIDRWINCQELTGGYTTMPWTVSPGLLLKLTNTGTKSIQMNSGTSPTIWVR